MNCKYTLMLFLALATSFMYQLHAGLASHSFEQTEDQSQKSNIEQLFLNAAEAGNLQVVQELISKVDSNCVNIALRLAARGHESLLRFLLTCPVDINSQNKKYGETALIIAIESNQDNIAKILLQVPDINVNLQDGDGMTALMWASAYGNENIAKLLLEIPGINLTAKRPSDGKTALMLGSTNESNGMFIYALQKKRVGQLIQDKITTLTAEAFTAISNLAKPIENKQKNIEALKTIVAQIGVDDIIDSEGNTLLDKAFAINNTEIILFLLNNAQNPGKLLERFPFELVRPTSDIFRLCMDMAYGETSKSLTQSSKKRTYKQMSETSPLAAKSPLAFASMVNGSHSMESNPVKVVHNTCAKCSTEHCEKKCSRCKKVFYCSVACQKKHWAAHQTDCKP